jgi:hypothetical protein
MQRNRLPKLFMKYRGTGTMNQEIIEELKQELSRLLPV